jgi:hypothetical protein
MEMIFCPNCGKLTGYKRALGFGTFFAVLLTAGLWLLAIPFYPKRCVTCGLGKSESVPWHQTWRLGMVILAGGMLLAILFLPSAPKVLRTAKDSPSPGATGESAGPGEASEVPKSRYLLLGATPDFVAAGQVQRGDFSTPEAQRLRSIEAALKEDEDNWIGHGTPGEPHCFQSSAAECRRVFLSAITYKPIALGPGREGLIVEVSRMDFGCGNHVCPGFVLRKIRSGYETVLRGNSFVLTVAQTATNGYYDILEGETKYVWDGSKYSAR